VEPKSTNAARLNDDFHFATEIHAYPWSRSADGGGALPKGPPHDPVELRGGSAGHPHCGREAREWRRDCSTTAQARAGIASGKTTEATVPAGGVKAE
jgi:hypothetical protein